MSKVDKLKALLEKSPDLATHVKPGEYKLVTGTGYNKTQAYAARNKKGHLAYFTTSTAAQKHSEH